MRRYLDVFLVYLVLSQMATLVPCHQVFSVTDLKRITHLCGGVFLEKTEISDKPECFPVLVLNSSACCSILCISFLCIFDLSIFYV